ncbi:MAG: hypothetical protein ABI782_01460 [Anaerolineaceae bacterium]
MPDESDDFDEEDRIPLGADPDADLGLDLGPDERDMDLMDGSWEQRYYAGKERGRDWNTIGVGIALLVLISFVVPMFLVFR